MVDPTNKRETELFIRDNEWARWHEELNNPECACRAAWDAAWEIARQTNEALEALLALRLLVSAKGYVVGLMMEKEKATGTKQWIVMIERQSIDRSRFGIPPFRNSRLIEAIQKAEGWVKEQLP
jgi:hypothetical protein